MRVSVNRVSGGTEPPLFTTDDPASIEVGQQSVTVLAHHCDFVEGELIGTGTGQPAQAVVVGRPPIIAPTGNELDLVVGVEARPDELTERVPARDYDGKPFRIWQEVDSFVNRKPDETVYVADRFTGQVVFAPALHLPDEDADPNAPATPLAAVPAADREIRAWYRCGGGSAGNIPAGAISVLKDTVPGVRKVTNPAAATGGRPAELLEEALIRGPQELHGVERAVTADDYEAIALKAGGAVARARAFTKAAIWEHALPGTVEMLLVPYVDDQELSGGRLTPEILHAHETDTAKTQIQLAIDERRPLGTTCQVNWASYKTVRVKASVVVRREENLEAVGQRLEQRLYATINPLPSPRDRSAGWAFGQALRASHVYDILLKEPGVRFVDGVRMFVESAPDTNVLAIARDEFQPGTWYAGAGETVFRSFNDAASWEPVASFPGETVRRIESHPELSGHVAVVSAVAGGSRLHVSLDTGENWDRRRCASRSSPSTTSPGACRARRRRCCSPRMSACTRSGSTRGQRSSRSSSHRNRRVASTQSRSRSTRSALGTSPSPPRPVAEFGSRAKAERRRRFAIPRRSPARTSACWQSSATDPAPSSGREPRLPAVKIPARGRGAGSYAAARTRPKAGSRSERAGKREAAWGLAFHEGTVYAATHHGGVARLDARRADSAWTSPGINSGLPLRDPTQFLFEQLDSVAAGPGGLVLAGGDKGVFASTDGERYSSRSQTEFTETGLAPKHLAVRLRNARDLGRKRRGSILVKRQAIVERLPDVFKQAATGEGNPLAAVLGVMEKLHARDEEILAGFGRYVDPRRTPDEFVPYLATWVDYAWLLLDPPDDPYADVERPFAGGLGRLRELVASAASESKWRGTSAGLVRMLETGDGRSGLSRRRDRDRRVGATASVPRSRHRAPRGRAPPRSRPANRRTREAGPCHRDRRPGGGGIVT